MRETGLSRGRVVRPDRGEGQVGRVEEILEVAEIVGEAADRLAAVLERSGAPALPGRATLREIARHELELAAADVGLAVFGGPIKDVPE